MSHRRIDSPRPERGPRALGGLPGRRESLKRRINVEALEARQLMAGQILSEYPLPPSTTPTKIALAPDGSLWFSENGATPAALGRVTTSGQVSQPVTLLAGDSTFGLTLGPDSNLWTTEQGTTAAIASVVPSATSATATEYTNFQLPNNNIEGITRGPAGDTSYVWFVDSGANAIGRVDVNGPANQLIQEFPLPANRTVGSEITAGPAGDNGVYFLETATAGSQSFIAKIDFNGAITEFPVTNSAGLTPGTPTQLTAGPNDSIYFTEQNTDRIGVLNLATGVVNDDFFAIPNVTLPGNATSDPAGPEAIAEFPDGSLMITESNVGGFARLTVGPTGAVNSFYQYSAFVSSSGALPGLASDQGGNPWFTESATSRIGTLALPNAPLQAQPATITAVVNQALTNVPIATFTDPDGPSPSTQYTATIDWGDGTALDTNVTFSPVGTSSTFQLLGSHTYTNPGKFTPVVTITDLASPRTATVLDTATVTNAAQPPLQAQPVAITGVINQPLSNIPIATFSDPNGPSPSTAFTATINWGDGTPVDSNVTFNPVGTSNTFQLLGSHTYATAGNFIPVVTITDSADQRTATAFDTAHISVSPVGPAGTIMATAGTPFLGISAFGQPEPVATFTVPSTTPTGYQATIDWGDGTALGGATITGPTLVGGVLTDSIIGTHTFAKDGIYNGSVTLKNPDGSLTVFPLQSQVSTLYQVIIGGSPTGVHAIAGTPVTTGTTPLVLLLPRANFPDPDPIDYTATINWGDGSPTTAAQLTSDVDIDAGTHIYAAPGTYTITYTLGDSGAPNLVSGTVTATVKALTGTPIAQSGVVGTPIGGGLPVPLEIISNPLIAGGPLIPSVQGGYYSATIDYGDGSPTSTGTVLTDPTTGNLTVDGPSHIYQAPGTYAVNILIGTTGQPDLAVLHTTITVTEAPIAINGALNPASDSGISNSDGITNITTPSIFGVTAPGATVKIYAIPTTEPGIGPVLVGQGFADASGAYSVTTLPLNDGSYDIDAVAISKFGTQSAVALIESGDHPLVIDTVGPKITGFAVTNTLKGQFQVTYRDERSGLVTTQLVNGANYDVERPVPAPRPLQHFTVSKLGASPQGPPTAPITVTGSVFNGHYQVIRGGEFLFTINAAGITDVAGNALDGEFYGTFPTGDGHPGGDFKAEVIVRGYTPSGPIPFTTANPANPGVAAVSPTSFAPKLKKPGLNAPPTSLPGVFTGQPLVSATSTHHAAVTKLAKAKPVVVKTHKA